MIFVNKIIILFSLVLIVNVFSQTTLQEQYKLALDFYSQEKYFDAITELKRLQFFDDKKEYLFQSNYLIAKSYKEGAKYDEAIKYFTLAEISSKNEEDYFSSKIYNARTNILRRTNKQAERILNELFNDSRFAEKQEEIMYWMGWNYIFSDEWENAQNIFITNNLDTVLADICKKAHDEMYSVDFAKYSSYIIPGFGQFYTEEYFSGTISLGWNILFGYLTINAFLEDRVFDGIIIGNFLWLRFYTGSIKSAENFAKEKNLKISNSVLEYLQNTFGGKKP